MRSLEGTATNASRLMAVMVGKIIIDRTSTAGRIPGPLKSVEKNGNQPNWECNQLQKGRISGMTTNSPQRPYTTLGTAASNSIRFLRTVSTRVGNFPQNG